MDNEQVELPIRFGDLLRYLRKHVSLTQRELGVAVGYSESQINKLEKGRRVPDLEVLSNAFVEALKLTGEPTLVARLIELATATHSVSGARLLTIAAGHNLPIALTSFIGRTYEIDALIRVLLDTRLVTLLGPGGCGKSRLALEVAHRLRAEYADGAWFVELASVSDPEAVGSAIADTLKLTLLPSQPMSDALAAALCERHMLLVLDNCEQVAESCAGVVEKLLSRGPWLKIMATSREPLHAQGERQWLVPALVLPKSADLVRPIEELVEVEAVRLFIERAQSAGRPRSVLSTRSGVRVIIDICRKLDGMPLAIELAAARVSTLGIDEICARLDDRFKLLVSSRHTANQRQQSLRTTIDWSVDMLSPKELMLFQRLSIFVGGWTLDAVEAVCADANESATDETLHPSDVIDVLSALLDKSLVRITEGADVDEDFDVEDDADLDRDTNTSLRYGMLETIREYVRNIPDRRVSSATNADAIRVAQRHADYFLDWVEQAEIKLFGREQVLWLHRLNRERDNIRAALSYFIAAGQPEGARRLAGSMRRFWQTRGRASEGRTWLTRALALTGAASVVANTKAYFAAAVLANYQGDMTARDPLLRAALELVGQTGDPWLIGQVLGGIVSVPPDEDGYQQSKLKLTALLANARHQGNNWLIGNALHKLATLELDHGQLRVAQRLFAEANVHLQAAGDDIYSMLTLVWLGNIALKLKDMHEAEHHYIAALELVARSGIEYAEHIGVWYCLRGMAEIAAANGDGLGMARLLGATEAEQESQGGMPDWWFALLTMESGLALYSEASARTHITVGEVAYRTAWRAGRLLTLEDAVRSALQNEQARIAKRRRGKGHEV